MDRWMGNRRKAMESSFLRKGHIIKVNGKMTILMDLEEWSMSLEKSMKDFGFLVASRAMEFSIDRI